MATHEVPVCGMKVHALVRELCGVACMVDVAVGENHVIRDLRQCDDVGT